MKKSEPNSTDVKKAGSERKAEATSRIRPSKDFPEDKADFLNRATREVLELVYAPPDLEKNEVMARARRALELYEGINPSDSLEGMLATQMVGTHEAALACLRRAAAPGQTFEAFDMALKNAQKMMALYNQQLAALDKHRGKGQQKVTVEHVHIQAGAQAVIGNVESKPRDPGRATAHIEEQRDIPMNLCPNLPQKRRKN